ncbi:S41 family peptidase [bacterium]|nr:S41 family peptidase [candidate division CSSED10-310 bacterium]
MKKHRLEIIIIALATVLLFGSVMDKFLVASDNVYEQIRRFMDVFTYVKKYYVEEIETEEVVTGAIEGMLEKLDPHSVYIEAKQMNKINEQFTGHYHGIGIEFIIKDKVLTVISPIAGSPSEALGIRPGDQLIKIEGKSAYGITEQDVFNKLRGPKDSKVTVTIRRPGVEKPFDITITRDKIPIYSVMTSFMLTDKIGYIYVGRFAKTTVDELEEALLELEGEGMKKLLLDLRGNSGGYLDQAVMIADKFIAGNKKIVYTRGRRPETNDDFYSTDRNTHPHFPLIILIDKGSASASEIVAGAVQDWDRGLIVGETSFGKGLVQNQIGMKDGSALRLTTARYYTPSGRLIQRPYSNGLADYYAEGYDDIDPNTIEDSTATKPVYYTNSHRKVYGGGGITPDVTIKSERLTKSTAKLMANRIFFEFASQYVTKHADLANNFEYFRDNFSITDRIMMDFNQLVKTQNIEVDEAEIDEDIEYIKVMLKSEIARNLWDSKYYYQFIRRGDEQVQEAAKLFPEAAQIAGIVIPQ